MLKLQRKHKVLVGVLVVVFALAWAVWTFFLLPASETPSLPIPATPGANTTTP